MMLHIVLLSVIAVKLLEGKTYFNFQDDNCNSLRTRYGLEITCNVLKSLNALPDIFKFVHPDIISKITVNNCSEKTLHKDIFIKNYSKSDVWIDHIEFDCPFEHIDEDSFNYVYNLQRLWLYNLNFTRIPPAILKLTGLKWLRLQYGQLSHIGQDVQTLSQLRDLELSYNKIQTISERAFTKLRELENLNLNYNKIKNFFPETFSFCQNLVFIEVEGNELEAMYELPIRESFLNLLYLNLKNNNFKTLPKDLFSRSMDLEFLELSGNPWICDCRLLWIHDWYKNKISSSKSLICHEPERFRGKNLTDLSENDLTDMPDDCPPACSCTCIDENENYFISVNCSARNLTQFPDIFSAKVIEVDLHDNSLTNPVHFNYEIFSNLRTLNLESNFIKSLDFPVPENVSILLLANNKIERFFSRPPLNVSKWTLGGNPWTCDCKTIQFRKWMLSEKTKIRDINLTRCNIERSPEHLKGKVIVNLSEVDLCPTPLSVYIIIVFTIMSILLLGLGSIVFYNRYHYSIKVWLYSRGCTFLKKDFEEDREKVYDAFVSSADEDLLIVRNFILPELEDNSPYYSLFEPRRNMKAGEMFQQEKEMEEIQKSKRIIILLSEYYMNNNFLMGIFKFAFDSSLEEKVYRLILIIVGDLPPLSDDNLYLKAAMESKQCLRYGERMFREKLLFAMPEKEVYNDIYQNLSQTDVTNNDDVGDDSLLIP